VNRHLPLLSYPTCLSCHIPLASLVISHSPVLTRHDPPVLTRPDSPVLTRPACAHTTRLNRHLPLLSYPTCLSCHIPLACAHTTRPACAHTTRPACAHTTRPARAHTTRIAPVNRHLPLLSYPTRLSCHIPLASIVISHSPVLTRHDPTRPAGEKRKAAVLQLEAEAKQKRLKEEMELEERKRALLEADTPPEPPKKPDPPRTDEEEKQARTCTHMHAQHHTLICRHWLLLR